MTDLSAIRFEVIKVVPHKCHGAEARRAQETTTKRSWRSRVGA